MFVDGSDFEEIFETTAGRIRVFAEVHTYGLDLILDEVIIYPDGGEDTLQPGVGQMLEIVRAVHLQARAAGFERLIATWHRVGFNRSGRIIVITRSLL